MAQERNGASHRITSKRKQDESAHHQPTQVRGLWEDQNLRDDREAEARADARAERYDED